MFLHTDIIAQGMRDPVGVMPATEGLMEEYGNQIKISEL